MLILSARDGARFAGTIQKIGSQIRVSYAVSLDLGSRVEMQRDAGAFPSEDQAIGWLQNQAAERGFEYFSLEWRPALGSDISLRQPGQLADNVRETTAPLQFKKA